MGKKQHSKDRMFITASEWASEYGGKKRARTEGQSQPLPFDHCALSLMPFETPVMLKNSGIVYDFVSIVPYLKEHKKDPATGEQASSKDIVRLNMAKNSEGQWHW